MSLGLPADEIHFATGASNHKLFNLPLPTEEMGMTSDPTLTMGYFLDPVHLEPRKILSPFVAAAIAATLLGQVLETKDNRDLEAFTRLDTALQALAMDLILQAGEVCDKSCAAISMTLT
jgi:hypothetical protein